MTPDGWACLPVFGMVSHMEPDLLTYMDAAIKQEEEKSIRKLLAPHEDLPKIESHEGARPAAEAPQLAIDIANVDFSDENTSEGECWETTSEASPPTVMARKISWVSEDELPQRNDNISEDISSRKVSASPELSEEDVGLPMSEENLRLPMSEEDIGLPMSEENLRLPSLLKDEESELLHSDLDGYSGESGPNRKVSLTATFSSVSEGPFSYNSIRGELRNRRVHENYSSGTLLPRKSFDARTENNSTGHSTWTLEDIAARGIRRYSSVGSLNAVFTPRSDDFGHGEWAIPSESIVISPIGCRKFDVPFGINKFHSARSSESSSWVFEKLPVTPPSNHFTNNKTADNYPAIDREQFTRRRG